MPVVYVPCCFEVIMNTTLEFRTAGVYASHFTRVYRVPGGAQVCDFVLLVGLKVGVHFCTVGRHTSGCAFVLSADIRVGGCEKF